MHQTSQPIGHFLFAISLMMLKTFVKLDLSIILFVAIPALYKAIKMDHKVGGSIIKDRLLLKTSFLLTLLTEKIIYGLIA